jgi:hypothetical protein
MLDWLALATFVAGTLAVVLFAYEFLKTADRGPGGERHAVSVLGGRPRRPR